MTQAGRANGRCLFGEWQIPSHPIRIQTQYSLPVTAATNHLGA